MKGRIGSTGGTVGAGAAPAAATESGAGAGRCSRIGSGPWPLAPGRWACRPSRLVAGARLAAGVPAAAPGRAWAAAPSRGRAGERPDLAGGGSPRVSCSRGRSTRGTMHQAGYRFDSPQFVSRRQTG
jgi:hypothetical protein